MAELKEAVRNFVYERHWQKYHTPKNLAESICIEAAELLQLFQWMSSKESEQLKNKPQKLQEIEEELADVVIYCLSMANILETDVSRVVLDKLKKNAQKYPIGIYRGKARL